MFRGKAYDISMLKKGIRTEQPAKAGYTMYEVSDMDELRVGVVGCGAIGKDHIRRINQVIQGACVTAVADVNVEGGMKTAAQWNAEFYSNGEEMIRSSQVDAVLIATLDQFHEQYAVAAIQAGKPVFCEKPLAPDAASCKRIMDAEIAGGRRLLQVGFMRRYDAGYRALKEAVASRQFGEPLMLHCAHRADSIAPNYVTSMLITNCAVHEIDVLRWLTGEDYRRCQVIQPKPTKNAWETLNDPIILLLETESGIRIDVEVFVNCRYGYDIRCEVVCEEGTLSLPTPTGILTAHAGQRAVPISADWQARFIDAYDLELQEWADNARQGKSGGPTAWDGYACAVTATAAVKALESGWMEDISLGDCPEFYKDLSL